MRVVVVVDDQIVSSSNACSDFPHHHVTVIQSRSIQMTEKMITDSTTVLLNLIEEIE